MPAAPAISAAALVLVVAPPAGAEPWLEAHAEVGLVSGHFAFEKPYRTPHFEALLGEREG